MAQKQNSTNTSQNSQKKNTTKNNFKQRNTNSHQQKQKFTQGSSPTLKGGQKQNRNEKRRRWAKKHKPTPKPAVKRGPVKEYVTKCCGALGRKPQAGEKVLAKDPDSGKLKETPKGLGHWRCSECGKIAVVTPRKPASKEVTNENPVASLVSPTNVV